MGCNRMRWRVPAAFAGRSPYTAKPRHSFRSVGAHFDKQGIYRIKLRITLPDSYKLFLYSLGVTPFIRKKKRPKVVESA